MLADTHRSKGPIIFTFDPDGRDEQTLFTLKDAALISVFDVAASQDGELAVAGSAVTADTPATCFVARIAADRNNRIVTGTWPILFDGLNVCA